MATATPSSTAGPNLPCIPDLHTCPRLQQFIHRAQTGENRTLPVPNHDGSPCPDEIMFGPPILLDPNGPFPNLEVSSGLISTLPPSIQQKIARAKTQAEQQSGVDVMCNFVTIRYFPTPRAGEREAKIVWQDLKGTEGVQLEEAKQIMWVGVKGRAKVRIVMRESGMVDGGAGGVTSTIQEELAVEEDGVGVSERCGFRAADLGLVGGVDDGLLISIEPIRPVGVVRNDGGGGDIDFVIQMELRTHIDPAEGRRVMAQWSKNVVAMVGKAETKRRDDSSKTSKIGG